MNAGLRTRLFNSLSVGGFDACWEWHGDLQTDGYGRIWLNGKTRYVHRVLYEEFRGPIPDGVQIDHLCRNRCCANPRHMELVTSGENTLRGEGLTAQNARKTHCVNGHEFSEENTRRYGPDGRYRMCRACQREWAYAKYHSRTIEWEMRPPTGDTGLNR